MKSFLLLLYLLAIISAKPSLHINQLPILLNDVTVADDYPVKSCGEENDIFQLTEIKVFPNPPQKGQKLKLIIKGNLTEAILEGSIAHAKVKLGLIKWYEGDVDFCKEALSQVDMQCPVEPGFLEIEKEIEIPSFVPSGKYIINVFGKNPKPNEKRIACFDVNTSLH